MISLTIDREFSSLIAPLAEMEFRFLEASIRKDGCLEPITVWRNIIVDGHNRYRICQKWNIPFSTEEKQFVDRVEAISWICAKQLGRRNISEETRKYLIGRQFDAEKILHKRNMEATRLSPVFHVSNSGDSQESPGHGAQTAGPNGVPRKNPTAGKIGDAHHISHSTVEKYALYSRALDVIGHASPSLQERILSGKCKLSYVNVITLSRMEPSAIREVAKHLDTQTDLNPFIPYHCTREAMGQVKADTGASEIHPGIKQMPKPDPDADVNRLALTVTAWNGAIRKAQAQLMLSSASADARVKLAETLKCLSESIESILQAMEGEIADVK